jgi:hypothetical protein
VPVLRKIFLEAYPYQMQLKFAGQDIADDPVRNKRLISLFDQFFEISYDEVLEQYCQTCERSVLKSTYLAHERGRYTDVAKATKCFIDFVVRLLQQ